MMDLMAQFRTPLGQPGSGAARYAAAMQLYVDGRLPAEVLEIYRRCLNLDHEDPVALAQAHGLCPEPK